MYQVIGTCGSCGGAVRLPTAWWSIIPPTPTCHACGARPTAAFGPVIEMDTSVPAVSALDQELQCWEKAADADIEKFL